MSIVELYIYDVTNGMARVLSPALVGRTVEAVYHTSIVIFGKEYYYQGGISTASPGTTPFGKPIEKRELGTTELEITDLELFIDSISSEFSPEKYNLFENNCNHFSNSVSEFLVGTPIPIEILGQASEFKNTPIGNLLNQMSSGLTQYNNSNK